MLDKHFDTVNHTWKHSDKCSVLKVFRSQLLVIIHLPSVCQVFVKRTVLGLMDASLETALPKVGNIEIENNLAT